MSEAAPSKRWVRTLLMTLACLAVLGGAGLAIQAIYASEPVAVREGATRKSAMLVTTLRPEAGSFPPRLVATGTVMPSRAIDLHPRVAGRITWLCDEFEPGGFVAAGEPLVRLDPTDYDHTLAMRRDELARAKAELEIEEGRQQAARLEFEMLGEEIPKAQRGLVLRGPQLAMAKARVAEADTMVKLAKLQSDRTEVVAPFDAWIESRSVNIGSEVDRSQPLARIIDHHVYWIDITLPQAKLPHLALPANGKPGSTVRFRVPGAWGEDTWRTGHVLRLVGTLAGPTRLARVLAAVQDPLARNTPNPQLLIGSYVEVVIDGKPIEGCVRVPREVVRRGDTAWVAQDGRLEIRQLQVRFRDATHVYVSTGLSPVDHVVITDLATVVEGAALRNETPARTPAEDGAEGS